MAKKSKSKKTKSKSKSMGVMKLCTPAREPSADRAVWFQRLFILISFQSSGDPNAAARSLVPLGLLPPGGSASLFPSSGDVMLSRFSRKREKPQKGTGGGEPKELFQPQHCNNSLEFFLKKNKQTNNKRKKKVNFATHELIQTSVIWTKKQKIERNRQKN